ncbi:MAG: amidohydrolase family protein [Acidobacteria bacterium]|nr:amidohydrolase family protein [Acidobacteriota bacterium]
MNSNPSSLPRLFVTLVLALPVLMLNLANARTSNQPAAHTTPDPALLAAIKQIKAIDHHAHPMRLVKDGEGDNESDALTLEGIEPFPLPVRLRPDNPEYIAAWKALYGYPYTDATEAHLRELKELRRQVMSKQGDMYPAWVLDQLGIETMFANRVAMGTGLQSPRFRWVSFVDALLLPLSTKAARNINSDYCSFYLDEERLLKNYLASLGIKSLPATLDKYLATVVTPILEQQKRDGVVGVKFEAAYLRTLDFADADEADAKRIYANYVRGGEPPATEYKILQDYLFRSIAREAGRLGLAVHIHTGIGIGAYFNVTGSNPLLLESALNDPTLRKTNFVLVHGGWPFSTQTTALLTKPNVYVDFSAQTFLRQPHELSLVIRQWLEFVPEKVLFGTDAFGLVPEIGWEETGWLTTKTSRQALGMALTDMMNEGEITRDQALKLARMVLRENTINLYGFKTE